ncbi:hypothetical protein [Comamonas sp. 4034]|uniref:hypothetical protein n=1 Tax=Comamonas sp. 4034 TaxID=3156455 RepID=UPI003D1D5090
MTQQLLEKLEIGSGAPMVPDMHLFGIIAGEVDNPKTWLRYSYKSQGDPSKITPCTALRRRWASTFQLRADRQLVLKQLHYPFSQNALTDFVNEILEGDFWLDFRESFFGDGVRVFFIQRRMIVDSASWRSKIRV